MNSDELKNRTKRFAHRCIKLALTLPETSLGSHIQRQLIRSSTSVAANYPAVCLAQSKDSFVSKMSIAIEEADETAFWIETIVDEHLMSPSKVQLLLKEARELTSIFMASRKTSRLST
jgi:four helix bundle protein